MMVDQASSTTAGPAICTPGGEAIAIEARRLVRRLQASRTSTGRRWSAPGAPRESASAPNVVPQARARGRAGSASPSARRSRSRRMSLCRRRKSRPSVARSSGSAKEHFHGGALADTSARGGALDGDRLGGMTLAMQWLHQVFKHVVLQVAETLGVPVGAQHAHRIAAGCSSCRRRCSPGRRSPTKSAARRSRRCRTRGRGGRHAWGRHRRRPAACTGVASTPRSTVTRASAAPSWHWRRAARPAPARRR